ncbi:protein spaetzle isoform X2 [Aethina tumida]|uniref:protein spaetzle isoform X2 n=1 Tax=Aethina tumida TaxID=116153 RepID=UPI00214767AE|nr:protein spaetzle isoform X2 [Aethina tumida]
MLNNMDAVIILFGLILIIDGRPHVGKPINSTTIDRPEEVSPRTSISFNKTKTRILTGYTNFFGSSEQEVVFPDEYDMTFDPVPKIDGTPKCANGLTFCEEFDAYPYHHVKDILEEEHVHKDLFGKDDVPFEITNRIGEDEDVFVCRASQRTIYPKLGKNKNNKWKFIINQDDTDGYIQGIRVETCVREGNTCDVIGDLPSGFTTSCKQKYVYRRLLSLTENGKPVPDTFLLPSACCCAYKRNFDFLARSISKITPIK